MMVRSETDKSAGDKPGDMELMNLPSLGMDSDAILADTIHYHSRMLGRRTVRRNEPFLYQALVHATRDRLMERWIETSNKLETSHGKRACYLSLEFLMGRLLRNALLSLDRCPGSPGCRTGRYTSAGTRCRAGKWRSWQACGLFSGQLRHAGPAGHRLWHPL